MLRCYLCVVVFTDSGREYKEYRGIIFPVLVPLGPGGVRHYRDIGLNSLISLQS